LLSRINKIFSTLQRFLYYLNFLATYHTSIFVDIIIKIYQHHEKT
jgi:hypothetical protein